MTGVAGDDLSGRWSDVFYRDTLVHLGVMTSITAGTFQGYLKDRISGPLPYALADGCFIAGVFFWFAGLVLRHEPFRGPGRVPALLLALTIIPTFYFLHPGTPLLIQLAGLRSWSEFPVACLMALTVIQHAGHVRAYVSLILVLCAVTAIYGLVQYQAGPQAALNVTQLAQLRHGSSTFYFLPGVGTEFRAFSTFTFPAPFASMMTFGLLLAAGVAVSPQRPTTQRLLCAALLPLLFVAITVSGTRAALVITLAGFLALAWLRRLSLGQVALLPLLLGALHLATLLTSGRVLNRFASIVLQERLLWTYLYAPVAIAVRALREYPFGLGLGRTGVGVPFAIANAQPRNFFVGSDGDIGRAAVEMGIFGVMLLLVVVLGLIPYIVWSARTLRDSETRDVALGIAPMLLATSAGILIGSPLSTAPHGLIWWFLLGALLKLATIEAEREPGAAEQEAETDRQ